MTNNLFTTQRRREVGDNLTTFFGIDDDIVGLVWVGSGAEGFRDDYSDVDFLVVIRNGAIFSATYSKWLERLKALYHVIACYEERYNENERTVHLFLDNFLGLDLTFVRMSHLHARCKPYRIAFDKVGELEGILQHTLEGESITAPRMSYQARMHAVWKPIIQCATAIRRDEVWHALTLIEDVRRQTIHLAGIAYDVDTNEARHIDELPEMLLVRLRHTIPTSTSTPALRRALKTTVLMLFEIAHLIEVKLKLTGEECLAPVLEERLLSFVDAYS